MEQAFACQEWSEATGESLGLPEGLKGDTWVSGWEMEVRGKD